MQKIICFFIDRPKLTIGSIFIIVAGIIIFFGCTSKNTSTKEIDYFYLNHNDTVNYVGLATCASCHDKIAETFLRTGMGSSFHFATQEKSAADFGSKHFVYDTLNNFYYTPFWKNKELYFMEFRLEGKDTIHKRIEKIDYIIGSGQHTNSHLILRNGFVYQAPMTWYSQQKHWGLPPGFEKGNNSRFQRIINEECMSCHNAMPVLEKSFDNKFLKIGNGIDCERCHGPGELHVNLRLKGKTIKSKNGIDRTIVNPAKLSWQLQVDLCQRCHLQGDAVLKKDKTFTQFRPGMKLSDFYDVFMPDYESNQSGIIMASHAQRLQMSQCFIKSNKGSKKLSLTCINCHNPHVSVKETGVSQFNDACKKCHPGKDECKAPVQLITENDNNCVKCHIPKSSTIDIPHVTVHDHFIRKPAIKKMPSKGQLKGLYCINNENPTIESKIKGYLSYYEKFDQNVKYLNEARILLDKHQNKELEIYYWYLKGNSQKVIDEANQMQDNQLDAWGNYRISQAYMNKSQWQQAETYIKKAIKLQAGNFEFIYKQSVVFHHLGKSLDEEQSLKSVIVLNPNHTQSLNSLGFYYFKNGELGKANLYYQRALVTNPDYLPLLKNVFDYYISTANKKKAIEFGKRILKQEPGNLAIKSFLG